MMDPPGLPFGPGEVKTMHNVSLKDQKEKERRDHDYGQYAKLDVPSYIK